MTRGEWATVIGQAIGAGVVLLAIGSTSLVVLLAWLGYLPW